MRFQKPAGARYNPSARSAANPMAARGRRRASVTAEGKAIVASARNPPRDCVSTMTRMSGAAPATPAQRTRDRKSTRLNSSHGYISYAVFCLKKKKIKDSAASDLRYRMLHTTLTYDH